MGAFVDLKLQFKVTYRLIYQKLKQIFEYKWKNRLCKVELWKQHSVTTVQNINKELQIEQFIYNFENIKAHLKHPGKHTHKMMIHTRKLDKLAA